MKNRGALLLLLPLLLGFGIAGCDINGSSDPSPGSLDTDFGSNGIVTTAIGTSHDEAKAVAIQSDGKIVVAGSSDNGSNEDFALVRYKKDGSLDTTFGTGGKVTTAIGSGDDSAEAVAIQTDGKIVAAGYYYNSSPNKDFALVRYTTDGSLDTTFGSGGIVTTTIGSGDDSAEAIAIQSDGKIIATGSSDNGTNEDFALVRYTTTGSLDSTFGTGGKVTTDFGDIDSAYGVAIQTDGKIVAAGYSGPIFSYDFALVRYTTTGSLDTGFDTDGKVTTAIGSGIDWAYGIAIQTDGKIVAAGYAFVGGNPDFALVRYNTSGSLDTSLDTDGMATTAIGSGYDVSYALAIQTNGKIVAAGCSYNGSNDDFALVRYTTDGSLDTGFDTDGKVTTAVGSGSDPAEALAMAIQSDGKIVLAGYYNNGSNKDFALARYVP